MRLKKGSDQVDPLFFLVLSNLYGNLGYPISARGLLAPILEYAQSRFGSKWHLRLHVVKDYQAIAHNLSFYEEGEPGDGEPAKKIIVVGNVNPLPTENMMFPLAFGSRKIGSLELVDWQGKTASDIEIAEGLAMSVALALENERLQKMQQVTLEAVNALRTASNLQDRQKKVRTLSKMFTGKVQIYEERAQTVAGDMIECATSPDGGQLMLIADVMGKGAAAAFLGGIFRAGWHLIIKRQTHPLLIMKELNEFLYDELNGQTMFVTAALAHIDAEGETLSIINAGHTALYLQLKNAKSELKRIEPSGPPLGLFATPEYELLTFPTEGLERLYMPTDGLYSWGESALEFNSEELESTLSDYALEPTDKLWSHLQELRAVAPQSAPDDQALLVWENEPKN